MEMYNNKDGEDELRRHYMGLGLAVGMPIGIVMSILFVVITDTPGLIGVGAGMGVALGIAIGEGLYQRHKEG